ncbi:tRNA 4-thiouridine(8) synthase ThiI [Candidatus Micrarchaeota archaeon]|nr:tRNA 4-thiouridine(8) synthase ThiI [Candidatus Micrarchaeota archaeon]
MLVSVTSSEITLKGKNRKFFESALKRNMAAVLTAQITKSGTSRFLISTDMDKETVKDRLQKIFGLDTISFSNPVALDLEAIKQEVLKSGLTNKSIKVDTRRSNKKFPMTSQQVNEVLGKALVDAGCTVNLKNPEATVFVDLLEDSALVSFEKVKGLGGLPVGTSGKVLSLLSGGIDSPVASWLMMKRGCTVDFLHVHSTDPKNSKMIKIVKKLREYSPRPMRLFLIPYTEFYKKTLTLGSQNELVVFRRFIIKLANKLAKRKYKAFVTGDSVGQVASQTLDNLMTTTQASKLPVFRPLIGFNKSEIIDLAIKIDTYDLSIERYQDCCSLVASRPTTNVTLDAAKKLEEQLNIDELVEKSIELCELIEI